MKGKVTIALYALAIVIAFIKSSLSLVLYFIIACIWIIPDKRIETKIIQNQNQRD